MPSIKQDTLILVVDDVINMCQTLKGVLNKLGYRRVLIAQSGDEALQAMATQKANGDQIGLILCDWNMKGMSGLDLLKTLRKSQEYATLPFIMITSEGDVSHILDAANSGVSSYIVKPLSMATLEAKLNHILG